MRHDIDLAISKPLWWTQNRRSRSWAVPYRRKKQVKTMSLLTFRNLINSGKLQKPEHWPVHVTAIIHPLTHGRFDPENAAPMVKAILDGITQSGYWPDDNADYVLGPDYRLGEPSTEKGVYHITLNEIVGMCVEKRTHYRQFLNDFILTHSEDWHDSAGVTYGERIMFLRGKIQAFDECAACCESMLGYTGSMPSEVPNQSEDAK